MLWLRVAPAPLPEGVARPESCRLPDDRMGHAIGDRVAPPGRARLECGPRNIPLQEVRALAGGGRQVRQLVNEQALAGAREPGEEHDPVAAQSAELRLESTVGPNDEARASGAQGVIFPTAALPSPHRSRAGSEHS